MLIDNVATELFYFDHDYLEMVFLTTGLIKAKSRESSNFGVINYNEGLIIDYLYEYINDDNYIVCSNLIWEETDYNDREEDENGNIIFWTEYELETTVLFHTREETIRTN